MNIYLEYEFVADRDHFEIVIAFLSQYAFESFQEKEDRVLGWVQESNMPIDFEKTIRNVIPVPFEVNHRIVPNKNWNAEWESQFEPVVVDDFCCIRADFHENEAGIKYDIVINPKMAFGTGHHETTEMMVRYMASMDIEGKSIFDFGTGTGVLAILAHKMGAKHIVGIDNDANAVENAIENIKCNQTPSIIISDRDISSYRNERYDLILSNVNRNAILSSIQSLTIISDRVLISGILVDDKQKMYDAFAKYEYSPQKVLNKGEWLCIDFLKRQ